MRATYSCLRACADRPSRASQIGSVRARSAARPRRASRDFSRTAVETGKIREKLSSITTDATETEKSFNLVELSYDLFAELNMTDAQFDALVEKLTEMWAARLRTQYPERKFIVEVEPLDPTDPDSDLGMTVYQDRTGVRTAP